MKITAARNEVMIECADYILWQLFCGDYIFSGSYFAATIAVQEPKPHFAVNRVLNVLLLARQLFCFLYWD